MQSLSLTTRPRWARAVGKVPSFERLPYYQVCGLALDIFACSLVTRKFDVTLSTTADLHRDRQPWKALYIALNTCFPHHCERARQHDFQRAQEAEALLELRKRGPKL